MRAIMRAIKMLLPLVLLLHYCQPSAAGDLEYASYAFGRVYWSTIADDALAKTPRWKSSEENPPVSARKAIQLADARREQLVKDTKDFKWSRVSVAIEFTERPEECYWKISYEAHIRVGGESGVPHHLDLYVLMDGKLIEPAVSNQE